MGETMSRPNAKVPTGWCSATSWWDLPREALRHDLAFEAIAYLFWANRLESSGSGPAPQEYDDDMKRAKALGIDAFALNIGVDPYTDQQLGYAYQSAANNDMKVFISFDFNW